MTKILRWVLSLAAISVGLIPLVAALAGLGTKQPGETASWAWLLLLSGVAGLAFAFIANPLSSRISYFRTTRGILVGCTAALVIGVFALIAGFIALANLGAADADEHQQESLVFFMMKHQLVPKSAELPKLFKCISSDSSAVVIGKAGLADGDKVGLTPLDYLQEYNKGGGDISDKNREFFMLQILEACREN